MTKAIIAHTDLSDSTAAGRALGDEISASLNAPPNAVIVFISPTYNQADVLTALKQACQPHVLVGCSSSGEFTSDVLGEGLACALAIHSDDMHFSAVLGRNLSADLDDAAQKAAAEFQGLSKLNYHYRYGLVLIDALNASPEEFVDRLTIHTGGSYQFFGGGSGDNFAFNNTPVFYDSATYNDAVVILEILSNKPLGIGVRHDWQPAGEPMRVTEAYGQLLVSINGRPALEAIRDYAYRMEQILDLENPLHFCLHNLIGIDIGGAFKLRGILKFNDDGSLWCGGNIPSGAIIQMMNATITSSIEAAAHASRHALQKLYGNKPAAALVFDCPATRYRMGDQFICELEAVQNALSGARYIGCNSHGQVARTEGQFYGYMNCTALVCIIPE